eukprot:m.14501 g.14501  ORF g.14501 m.14501 type:complete len:215 (-) comp10296_c0_seq1:114-758(-)
MARKTADFKIIIVGPPSAGKTCLIERFNSGTFNSKTQETLGVSFVLKDAYGMYLALWDTAGQERYAALSSFYARDAAAALICYDVTDGQKFEELDKWYAYLNNAPKSCQHILVGCKSDLIEASPGARQVDAAKAYEVAQDKGSAKFLECSSKTGHNIEAVFQALCEVLRPGSTDGRSRTPPLALSNPPPDVPLHTDAFQLTTTQSTKQPTGGCC